MNDTVALIPTRCFSDAEHARETLWCTASKATAEILYLLDSSTGPAGDVSFTPSEHEVQAYKQFRAWFGPQIATVIHTIALGPVISALLFDNTGAVGIDRGVALGTGRTCDPISGKRRSESRAAWLIDEIQSLNDYYGELYENEIEEMLADCKAGSDFDFENGDPHECVEVLSRLETWYMFAQPGARFMRGDENAIKNAEALINESKKYVSKMEGERKQVAAEVEGGALSSEAALNIAIKQLEQVDGKIDAMTHDLSRLTAQKAKLQSAISGYGK